MPEAGAAGYHRTVSVVLPLMPPELAVIVTVPEATAVANPVLFIEATDELLEFHATEDVISAVVLFE
jgi:hypothetical protein